MSTHVRICRPPGSWKNEYFCNIYIQTLHCFFFLVSNWENIPRPTSVYCRRKVTISIYLLLLYHIPLILSKNSKHTMLMKLSVFIMRLDSPYTINLPISKSSQIFIYKRTVNNSAVMIVQHCLH